MSMIISQEFMQIEVINPMARRLTEIEKKIDVIKNSIDSLHARLAICGIVKPCEPEAKIEIKLPEEPKPKNIKKVK